MVLVIVAQRITQMQKLLVRDVQVIIHDKRLYVSLQFDRVKAIER
jgi:hypothetical protein